MKCLAEGLSVWYTTATASTFSAEELGECYT